MGILKLIWGETAGKALLVLAVGAFVGGLGLAYSVGNANGYASGHTAGYNSRDQQVETLGKQITTLTDLVNSQREAEAEKIDKIESEAADAAVETQKQFAQKLRERERIIADYEARTPTVIKQSCGLSIETVRAINLLIDNANEQDDTTPIDSGGSRTGGGTDAAVPSTLQEGAAQ